MFSLELKKKDESRVEETSMSGQKSLALLQITTTIYEIKGTPDTRGTQLK